MIEHSRSFKTFSAIKYEKDELLKLVWPDSFVEEATEISLPQ